MNILRHIGATTLRALANIGRLVIFLFEILNKTVSAPFYFVELVGFVGFVGYLYYFYSLIKVN